MPTFAAVDIGSNSVRLKIARLQAGRLRALHEDREVTRLGADHPKTDFVSFPSAKTDLQNAFPAEEHAVAKFLSSFLKPNCSLEVELTLAMRSEERRVGK